MGDVGVPGVENTAGLARWIHDNGLPGAGQDLTVELIAGGRSNLTYRLAALYHGPNGVEVKEGPAASFTLSQASATTRLFSRIASSGAVRTAGSMK